MKPKIYIVSQPWYIEPFQDLFEVVTNWSDADVLMFTGGSDVNPRLYDERIGHATTVDIYRDQIEEDFFNDASHDHKKFLGICRGSQFLTVMSGGKLVQDVTNHGIHGTHDTKTYDGEVIQMSSTHHQMMMPAGVEHKLIAWTEHRSKHYLNGENKPITHCGIEPEIVWYPETKALCIQGHPEIMDKKSDGVEYCRNLVKEYLV